MRRVQDLGQARPFNDLFLACVMCSMCPQCSPGALVYLSVQGCKDCFILTLSYGILKALRHHLVFLAARSVTRAASRASRLK